MHDEGLVYGSISSLDATAQSTRALMANGFALVRRIVGLDGVGTEAAGVGTGTGTGTGVSGHLLRKQLT